MSKFTLEPVTDLAEWDAFVEVSPQGTLFARSLYLHLAVDRWRLYWVRKGNAVKAGISLVLGSEERSVVLDDLVIHSGLMFAPAGEQKETKSRHEHFEITEFVIEWLDLEFDEIALSLAPQFEDMRPFLWHNYYSATPTDKFTLDLRYTSYVDICSLAEGQEEESSLFRSLETLRQRNIREARKVGASTTWEGDGVLFSGYYATLMESQGQVQDPDKLARLVRLIDGLVADGCGAVLVSRNPEGTPIYVTVFGWDEKRAYYLFGAPAPEANERYMGTISFWDGFRWLAEQGVDVVDMEGVNSPKRGWFKLGFGGDLCAYHEVFKNG